MISISLVSIIAIGLLTIFSLLWATDQADKDAQAINVAGSMRMQIFRIGLAAQQHDVLRAKAYIEQLDQTWGNPLFSQQKKASDSASVAAKVSGDLADELRKTFERSQRYWSTTMRPALLMYLNSPQNNAFPGPLIEHQLTLGEELVTAFQVNAERKIRRLRAIQLTALFLTIIAGSVIFYLIRNRLERPLTQLTQAAQRIAEGDYGYQVTVDGRDELAMLGGVVNHMSTSINLMYHELDTQVKQRTADLHNNNIGLEYLFSTARKILNSHKQGIDYQQLLDDLSATLGPHIHLELCLFTEQGDAPYTHIAPRHAVISDCSMRSCATCTSAAHNHVTAPQQTFGVIQDSTRYGVINVSSREGHPLESWQEKLLRSVADQFALALSLSAHKDQERRLAMLNERTVIARELHDSLAQALSYLQIQVTRLQKSIDKEQYASQQPIVDELREGLSSAYRQLRELLTTFRLKIDTGGLQTALELVVAQLNQRSDLAVTLHYALANVPLSPTEEIHLLQIVREASQNAVNHSQGTAVEIRLSQTSDQSIELIIDDDGIGIPPNAERTNHYGLAIISERGRHLNGQVAITPRDGGGTRVSLKFLPHFLR